MFEVHRSKIVGPLKTNSKLLKSESANIDRLIHRFSINSKYYSDKLEHNKKPENIDGEMGEFF